MKNNRTSLLADLNKSAEEISIFDIIDFIKGNTNSLADVVDEVIKATNNKAVFTINNGLNILEYNSSKIIIGKSSFNNTLYVL